MALSKTISKNCLIDKFILYEKYIGLYLIFIYMDKSDNESKLIPQCIINGLEDAVNGNFVSKSEMLSESDDESRST